MTDQATKKLLTEALIALSHWDYRQFEERANGEVYFRDIRVPCALVDEMGVDFACIVAGEAA